MPKKFRKTLRKLVHNPFVDVSVGLILLVTGLSETWETIETDLATGNLQAGHGLVVFGLFTALKAIADMFAGLEFMDEAEYVEKKK